MTIPIITDPYSIIGPLELAKPVPEKSSAQLILQPSYESRISDRRLIPYKTIRDIRVDPTIKLARMVVLSNFIHTPWDFEATSKAPSEAKNILIDMVEEHRNEFLALSVYGSLDFGWAPFETSWVLDEMQIKIHKLKPLLQDYTKVCVYTNSGDFAGLTNEPTIIGSLSKAVFLPELYSSVFNLEWEGTDWYGESVYLSLQDINTSWKDVETISNRFDRKIAGAIWVVYYPVGKISYMGVETENDVVAEKILAKLEGSVGIAIPSDIQEFIDDSVDKKTKRKWEIELVTASSTSQAGFIDRQKYLDSLKMRAFGLPERAVLEGTHGTKAEADTHTDIAIGTIGIKHNLICGRFNQQILNNALALNWGPKARNTVRIKPAPVTEARFNIIKEVYRLILSNDAENIEKQNINTDQMRKMLGIPSIVGEI